MRLSRKRNKCYAFRSSAKESQATICPSSFPFIDALRGRNAGQQTDVIFSQICFAVPADSRNDGSESIYLLGKKKPVAGMDFIRGKPV